MGRAGFHCVYVCVPAMGIKLHGRGRGMGIG